MTWWENFWRVFPCHEGKNRAMDAFERKVTKRDTAVLAFRGAEAYAAKARADPTLKLKWGQGWINEERWNDEVTISAPHSDSDRERTLADGNSYWLDSIRGVRDGVLEM